MKSSLMSVTDKHVFTSSYCTALDVELLRPHAVSEAETLLQGENQDGILRYMLRSGHGPTSWIIWGRSHAQFSAFFRTTKWVDLSWTVLKRIYLSHFNRPRVDALINTIQSQFLKSYEHDFRAISVGKQNTDWRVSICKKRKTASATSESNLYAEDVKNFTCYCYIGTAAIFFLCKCIGSRLQLPNYKQVRFSHYEPFLEIRIELWDYVGITDDERHAPSAGDSGMDQQTGSNILKFGMVWRALW